MRSSSLLFPILFPFILSRCIRCQVEECGVPFQHPPADKAVYTVGVLAIRGLESAFAEFNSTFSQYLTQAAGGLFNPPISFQLRPLDFVGLFEDVEKKQVDFIYVNPSAFSCIESEYGASSLVSQISSRLVGGEEYHLTEFGGVIFTLSDRHDVSTLQDLRNQRIAAASISGLGSGQMQFRLMQQAGLSYIQDPAQLVFTSNQGKVVNGVLKGDFDVGFVRTDQIERTLDASTGKLVDKNLLKIIEPQVNLTIDGEEFPFKSSTPLYPEWNVANLPHVSNTVARAVQTSLIALSDHAIIGDQVISCMENQICTTDECQLNCFESLPKERRRCDTTPETAMLARDAMINGQYAGFRSTLSYMELRNMQEETGFIKYDNGAHRCVRSTELYDAIVCPHGHFLKSREQVYRGCEEMSLTCKQDFQCICKPCVKAFDVDVFEVSSNAGAEHREGCGKFNLCGVVTQSNIISFRAVDNKRRDNSTMTVVFSIGKEKISVHADRNIDDDTRVSYTFSFNATGLPVSTVIFEVYIDDHQIPESPFRLNVVKRDCPSETGDAQRVADFEGNCVCSGNALEVGGSCVAHDVFLPAVLGLIALISAMGTFWYIRRKKKQTDTLWTVEPSELKFNDPPEILGRGTFGLVLLAEYRGTQVAVKRVIPPRVEEIDHTKKKFSPQRRLHVKEEGETKTSALRGLSRAASDVTVENNVQHTTSSENDARDSDEDFVGVERVGFRSRTTSGNLLCSPRISQPELQTDLSSAENGLSHSLPSTNDASCGAKQDRVPGKDALVEARYLSFKWAQKHSLLSSSKIRKSQFDFENEISEASPSCGPALGIPVCEPWLGLRMTRDETDNIGMKSGALHLTMMNSKKENSWFVRIGKRVKETSVHRCRRKDQYSLLKSDFIAEMRVLSKLRHPCITTVMGAVIARRQEPMLVMEYMDHGSLYDLLHNETMVIEGELVLPILRDIARGMRFLHAATPQVIHGDLKAQNVLVDSRFRAKVADFGLSQKKKFGATGTPLWMAPEVLRGEPQSTFSDMYSFGIVLYELYSRRDPYESENHLDVLRLVADERVNKRPPVPPSCPSAAAEMMMECLEADPRNRPSMENLDIRLKNMDVANVEPGVMTFSLQRKKSHIASRSEELLFQVFPRHIAQALLEGRKVEPEYRDCVTIFFSDIVGYTAISSQLSPRKVSDLLDRLYLKFDALSTKHDVFKIETIGDAYMCVTNLIKDQPDHAKRIAEFSIDACKAAASVMIDTEDATKGYVSIRVGFHSGPVVANVVGSKNPRYTLVGDTVNTASRMESTSHPGRIQCSDRSASLVRSQAPEIEVVLRGQIHMKGKGDMVTHWINEEARSSFSTTTTQTSENLEVSTATVDVSSSSSSSLRPIREASANKLPM